MTIEDVMTVVKEHTGKDITPETRLDSLGMDSLDFLDLIVSIGNISDAVVPHINTVNDLFMAAQTVQ
jgi:acyl carrier protein